MSWLRNDDDMLDHEKWRRALRIGGDAVLTTWWRLTSWCSRRLTDGRIPPDMVDEVAQTKGSKTRSKCLRALVEARLIERHIDGGLVIVDYLERNPSRADVLAERERRSQAQRNRRVAPRVTGHAGTSEAEPCSVPSQSRPVPIPIPAPEDPPVGPPGEAPSAARPHVPGLRRVARSEPAQGSPLTWNNLRDWEPPPELEDEAVMHNITREYFRERIKRARNKPIGGKDGVFSREEWVRDQFPFWVVDQRAEGAKRPTNRVDATLQRQAVHIEKLRAEEAAAEGRAS